MGPYGGNQDKEETMFTFPSLAEKDMGRGRVKYFLSDRGRNGSHPFLEPLVNAKGEGVLVCD